MVNKTAVRFSCRASILGLQVASSLTVVHAPALPVIAESPHSQKVCRSACSEKQQSSDSCSMNHHQKQQMKQQAEADHTSTEQAAEAAAEAAALKKASSRNLVGAGR